MSFIERSVSILKADLKMTRRDPMMLYSVLMIFIFLVLVRALKSAIPPHLYFAPALFSLLMVPLILGMVPGFIVVNEKEEKTIQGLQVLPISSAGFIACRLLWGTVLTAVLCTVVPVVLEMQIAAKPLAMLAALLILEMMIFALLVIDFSQTRMQALTITKIVGWILILPIAVKFVVTIQNLSTDWSVLTAFLPTYWVHKLYEGLPLVDYGAFWVGLGVHMVWLVALALIFQKKVL